MNSFIILGQLEEEMVLGTCRAIRSGPLRRASLGPLSSRARSAQPDQPTLIDL